MTKEQLERAKIVNNQIDYIEKAIKDAKEVLAKNGQIEGIALRGCDIVFFEYYKIIDTDFIFSHIIEKLEIELFSLKNEFESM